MERMVAIVPSCVPRCWSKTHGVDDGKKAEITDRFSNSADEDIQIDFSDIARHSEIDKKIMSMTIFNWLHALFWSGNPCEQTMSTRRVKSNSVTKHTTEKERTKLRNMMRRSKNNVSEKTMTTFLRHELFKGTDDFLKNIDLKNCSNCKTIINDQRSLHDWHQWRFKFTHFSSLFHRSLSNEFHVRGKNSSWARLWREIYSFKVCPSTFDYRIGISAQNWTRAMSFCTPA